MKWILIFWVASYQKGGPASAVFETETACRDASKVIMKQWAGSERDFICVPAGEAKPTVSIPQTR